MWEHHASCGAVSTAPKRVGVSGTEGMAGQLAHETLFPRNTDKSAKVDSVDYPGFTPFYGRLSPFSQWYLCKFSVSNVTYNCSEQYMMQQKALRFNDHESAEAIMRERDPTIQKQLGRGVRPWDQETWDRACVKIVFWGNFSKFMQNPDLLWELLATKNTILVEANPHDQRWGVGLAIGDPHLLSPSRWQGENMLGYILTEVRECIVDNSLGGMTHIPSEIACNRPMRDNRAFIIVEINGLKLRALIDTGAARTLMHVRVLKQLARATGRTLVLSPVEVLVTITGGQLELFGATEVSIKGIGPVAVTVVQGIRHDLVLGWDQLYRYGVGLCSLTSKMSWGGCEFTMRDCDHNEPGIAVVGIDSLVDRYPEVFGALVPRLGSTNLVKFHITTDGPPVRQRAYRAPLSK